MALLATNAINVQRTAAVIQSLTVSAPGTTYPPSGVDGFAPVTVPSGTAGTPSASKGAVSNHSVAVTPSVTNQAGFVASETKTGTPVTVSASELVSGTKLITQNETDIDVTNYQKVTVAVPSGGTDVSDTTATAGDVLAGKDFHLADGSKATGTIQSQAAQTIYPSTSDQSIAAGKYLAGAQTIKAVKISQTLAAANVAHGVTVTIGDADDPDRILNVTGTHQGGNAQIKEFHTDFYQMGSNWTSAGGTFTFGNGLIQASNGTITEASSLIQYIDIPVGLTFQNGFIFTTCNYLQTTSNSQIGGAYIRLTSSSGDFMEIKWYDAWGGSTTQIAEAGINSNVGTWFTTTSGSGKQISFSAKVLSTSDYTVFSSDINSDKSYYGKIMDVATIRVTFIQYKQYSTYPRPAVNAVRALHLYGI